MMIPVWAEQIGFSERQVRAMCSDDQHPHHIFEQLMFYAEHPATSFDVTFYHREPLLDVTLDHGYASRLITCMIYGGGAHVLTRLLKKVEFSDGTRVGMNEIWSLIYMPPDLGIDDVDLSVGEVISGAQGETTRHMISAMYHCRSRAEEDFFLARWIIEGTITSCALRSSSSSRRHLSRRNRSRASALLLTLSPTGCLTALPKFTVS
jgi:hypothetical protein